MTPKTSPVCDDPPPPPQKKKNKKKQKKTCNRKSSYSKSIHLKTKKVILKLKDFGTPKNGPSLRKNIRVTPCGPWSIGLRFGLSFHLHPSFVYTYMRVSKTESGKSICTGSSNPLLLDNVMGTLICWLKSS